MTDLKRFEYVLALSECLNFSRAAAKLCITQSTLSQYIQKIEDELGYPLFDRTSSALRPTAYGEIFISGAKKIMDIYSETVDCIEDADLGANGTLKIGISPSRAAYILPPVVSEFKNRYPGIRLEFSELKSEIILEKLDKGDIDFAYTVISPDNAEYERIPVKTEEIMLVKSKKYTSDYLNSDCSEIEFSALADATFIILGSSQMLYNDFYSLCRSSHIVPDNLISVSEISTSIALVSEGIGVMLLPSSYKNYGNLSSTLDFIGIKGNNSIRTVGVIHKKGKYLSKAAKCFIEILKNQ